MDSSIVFGVTIVTVSYLLGGIPFGLILSKIFAGMDPRKGGSGGIGFTNVMRTANKKAAFMTLTLDTLKGTLPVLIAKQMTPTVFWISAVALAGILGHIFSIYLKFKGGKGVATSFGVLLGISPAVAIMTFIIWNGVYFAWKYSSLAGLVSFAILPLLFFLAGYQEYVPFSLVLTVIIYFKHIDNIKRLIQGTENRMSNKVK
ncbi:MAG: glycerol-3-phosphate 1-O-acyltransferase PlsY [Nitrospiria bacterium]